MKYLSIAKSIAKPAAKCAVQGLSAVLITETTVLGFGKVAKANTKKKLKKVAKKNPEISEEKLTKKAEKILKKENKKAAVAATTVAVIASGAAAGGIEYGSSKLF